MKYEINNRWTGAVQVTAEIDCAENTDWRMKLGLAVKWAVKNHADLRAADLRAANLSAANLREADLRAANLSEADLRAANLSAANLSAANLSAANLRAANLSAANLSAANLSAANLREANLSAANLSAANLQPIRDDFWAVLSSAPKEVAGLRAALVEGRVDGSTYTGECACLVGTIANVAHKPYADLPVLKPNEGRPIERFFMGIRKGATPETSQFSKLAVEWLDQWVKQVSEAFAPVGA